MWVTEVWTDEDASDRALSADLAEVGIGQVIELLAGPPELVDLTPLGGPASRPLITVALGGLLPPGRLSGSPRGLSSTGRCGT